MKTAALERPPPGAGLKTVTTALPAEAMSAARTAAVTRELLSYRVARFAPLKRTTQPGAKFSPDTASEKAGPPAAAELVDRPEIEGTGLAVSAGGAAVRAALKKSEGQIPGCIVLWEG